MAKNSITDYDNIAANNTDIQSVDIDEGCAPSGINNAIREIMADLADVNDGTVPLASPDINGGTIDGVTIGGTTAGAGTFTTGTFSGDLTVDTDTFFVDSTNNRIGINNASPSTPIAATVTTGADDIFLDVKNTAYSSTDLSGESKIRFGWNNHAAANIAAYKQSANRTGFKFYTELGFNVENLAMTIDADGNLLVGTTINDGQSIGLGSQNGIVLAGESQYIQRGDNANLWLSKPSGATNSEYIKFYDNNTAVGSIEKTGSSIVLHSQGGAGYLKHNNGLAFFWYTTEFTPVNDNFADLGRALLRFDDIYATNGTIQTSDANEKQQIASLTDAEMTAAKAISKLFKTFKWNDKVEAKGDAARRHTGVIAQEVQQAMTDAGLDAGDYAFFISTTWWETQTEVPAVEAIEAQDAVYDEDGNIVTEAVEAVEAADAYTRTDTYDTAEDAPEGATERTRLGIRYPELLSFIGAATEQRLASIESRLDALENA